MPTIALALLLIFGLSVQAHAQTGQSQCIPHQMAKGQLESKYNEYPRVLGLEQRGWAVQLFASKAGDWTMVTISNQGLACIIMQGEALEILDPKEPQPAVREQKL